MQVRVRAYAAYSEPGRVNFGQELYDFHWDATAIQLALACNYIVFGDTLSYYVANSWYYYDSPDTCTIILNIVQTAY